jgi:hypothetical protein
MYLNLSIPFMHLQFTYFSPSNAMQEEKRQALDVVGGAMRSCKAIPKDFAPPWVKSLK